MKTYQFADRTIPCGHAGQWEELVRAGDVLVEYDKLIDRQLERAAITSISGFGKICDGASLVLNV